MSIYSVIAFNSALNQIKQNEADAQTMQAAKIKNQQAQEELDINKKLDLAKAKEARNQGLMSDYIGDALEKHLNDQYKPKQDILENSAKLTDMKLHQAQQQSGQLASIVQHLHENDPDVQAHVAGITAPSPAASVNPLTSGGAANVPGPSNPAMAGGTGPDGAKVPSIFPNLSSMPSPIQKTQQIMPPQQPEAAAPQTQAPAAEEEAPAEQAQTAQPAQETAQNGVDLTPMENAFGMPKGSLWLNPSTGKPDINPVWKTRMEAHQRAQENYDINQPFREEQRQDRNIKTAETYLVNSLKQRGGAIGLQNNKVDAAIHARALINQAYDPATGEYNITQVPYGELSESMGALLSGQSGSSEGRIAALKQKTAQGDVNAAISYFTGKPSNATSQDAIKQLVSIIDRQGEVSEDLRDKAFEKMKSLPTFSRLDEDSFNALKDQHLGNSFKEFVKDAPDKQAPAEKKFEEGKTYVDAKGNKAKYVNGQWVEAQ